MAQVTQNNGDKNTVVGASTAPFKEGGSISDLWSEFRSTNIWYNSGLRSRDWYEKRNEEYNFAGEEGRILKTKAEDIHSDFSYMGQAGIELGDAIQGFIDLVSQVGEKADTILKAIEEVMKIISELTKFISLNPLTAVIDEVIAYIDDMLSSIEDTGAFLLPIYPNEARRGVGNVLEQINNAFYFAESFRGTAGTIDVTAARTRKIVNNYLGGLLGEVEEKDEKEEDEEKKKRIEKALDLLTDTVGPNFSESDVVMGAGFIVSFSFPNKLFDNLKEVLPKIWRQPVLLATLKGFKVSVRRQRDDAIVSWTSLIVAIQGTDFSKRRNMYPAANEDEGATATGFSKEITCIPHIRISFYKEEAQTPRDEVSLDGPVKTLQEQYAEDNSDFDVWVCGLNSVDGGGKRSSRYGVNQNMIGEVCARMEAEIERLFPRSDGANYSWGPNGNAILVFRRSVSKEDDSIGNMYNYPMRDAEGIDQYGTCRLRVYRNEIGIIESYPEDEVGSVYDSGPIYIPTFKQAYDVPPPVSSTTTPWIGTTFAQLVPPIKTMFDTVRREMLNFRNLFDSFNNPLEDMVKLIEDKRKLVTYYINIISKTIDVIEKFINTLKDLSASASAWYMPPVNGSVWGGPGGNELIRTELEGNMNHLRSNGFIKDNHLTLGLYFFTGYPSFDQEGVNKVFDGIKAFLAMFNYFGIDPEKLELPATKTVYIEEGSNFGNGNISPAQAGWSIRAEGGGIPQGTTLLTVDEESNTFTMSKDATKTSISAGTKVLVKSQEV